jgi:hypothetical protein
MGRLILLLILVADALIVSAAELGATVQVTVAQIEQFLASQQAAHATDSATAQQLRGVELAEQLTEFRLERIEAEYRLGAETATELEVLADLSAFSDPPLSEVPEKSAPTQAEQQAMLDAARRFVNVTLRRLPDFLATRTTRSFEDVPVFTTGSDFQSGMHPIGTHVREVEFRSGREFATDEDPAKRTDRGRIAPRAALSSAGEFGPILATIMADSAHGEVSWGHWERRTGEAAAVFRYAVAKDAAHYEISFCCTWNALKDDFESYHGHPAYHGTISVDPVSGEVVGLTLEADFEGIEQPPKFELVVRYGRVEIEGNSLVCPERSAVVVRSTQFARKRTWNVVNMNDMTFTGYRRFGSTARVLANALLQ